MSEIQINLVRCFCQHCSGPMLFEADAAGQDAKCPHCGKMTWVDLPEKIGVVGTQAQAIPPVQILPQPSAPENRGNINISRSRVWILVLVALGAGLFFFLLSAVGTQETDREKDLAQQALKASKENDRLHDLWWQYQTNYYYDNGSKIKRDQIDQQEQVAYSAMIDASARRRGIHDHRIETSNIYFFCAVGTVLFWGPGLLYLFLVPKRSN